MILCDTNVFIHAFNGNETAIEQLKTANSHVSYYPYGALSGHGK